MQWTVNYGTCRFCGRIFIQARKHSDQRFCSKDHQKRQWRAVRLLERTTPVAVVTG